MKDLTIYSGNFGFLLQLDVYPIKEEPQRIRLRIRNPSNQNNDIVLEGSSIKEGKLNYTVRPRDFAIPGLYKLQVFDTSDNRIISISDIIKIKVKPSLDYVIN